MNSENILLDKVKEICGVPSDNALAVTLGVQRQAISKIRRDEMHLSDERIAELCGMAKLDGGEWLARIHAERAASPAEKALWRSVLDRLSAAAAVVALVVVAVHTGAHEGVQAALPALFITGSSIHYAKLRVGRRRQRRGAHVAALSERNSKPFLIQLRYPVDEDSHAWRQLAM